MARIETVPIEELAPSLAQALGNPSADRRVELGAMVGWARRPEVAVAFLHFQQVLHATTTLAPRLMELVRLRIAFHNQCRSCMAVRSGAAIEDGLDEGAVCSLERPYEAPDLSAAERVALRYADVLATDHLAADDALFDELREQLTEDEIVDLGIHVGTCVGFGRMAMSWDLVDDLPEDLRADGPVAPWSTRGVIR